MTIIALAGAHILFAITAAQGADPDEGGTLGGSDEKLPTRWTDAVAALGADDFADRQRAAAELEALPREALPWLEQQLANFADGGDPELLQRLSSVATGIRARVAEADIENGVTVKIELEDAKPSAALKAIEAVLPRKMIGENEPALWEDGREPAEFVFEGGYWDAIDKLFEVFPPTAAEEPGREKLDQDYDLQRLHDSDFAAVDQPSATAGVLRVRAARTALENSNGNDFLTLTLVPKLESTYIPDEVGLLLKGVKFNDGATVEPEDRLRSFKRSGYQTNTTYQPGRDFTWALPIEEGTDLSGPVDLDLKVQVVLRRLTWATKNLPKVGASVSLNEAITLSLEESNDDFIKVKFEGDGGPRIDFNQYSRHGTQRLFEILDERGEEIDIKIRNSSSGSGANDEWYQSFKCYYEDDKPVAVRVLLPGEQMTKQMPLEIKRVPLPGIR